MSEADYKVLYEQNLKTWALWDAIQSKEKEAILSQPQLTEEEWQSLRMSHAV